MGNVIGYIMITLFLGFCIYNVVKDIGTWKDHGKWAKGAAPDPNATIVNTQVEQVKYVKNGAKYKTEITFSDGYHFISHKTNVKTGFGHYTISIDRELAEKIKANAIAYHAKAVAKKRG